MGRAVRDPNIYRRETEREGGREKPPGYTLYSHSPPISVHANMFGELDKFITVPVALP